MFHTWESSQQETASQPEATGSTINKRRNITVRACEPCRRRKIRCNGEKPCETCRWYKKTAQCHYTEPRPRNIFSKKSIEQISTTLQEYREILESLFPSVTPQELRTLSRDRLIELLTPASPSRRRLSSPLSPVLDDNPPAISPDAANLEQLQPMPEESVEETVTGSSEIKGITDDVNALSLSVDRSTSYLGISSVTAALRVILWLDPGAQAYFAKAADHVGNIGDQYLSPINPNDFQSTSFSTVERSSPWEEIPLINGYFTHVHPFAPLIEEESFRNTYMTQKRTDSRWLLLLNTVLALGGITDSSRDENHYHETYWIRAKEHLSLETLGSAHIETIQALALLSGFYLHYIQQPNVATALMGATLRMATTLGLHRDYSEVIVSSEQGKATPSIELRRRIWWSIFILDAWVGYSLGRPSMGRMSHAISAKPPQEHIGKSNQVLTLMQENIRFCTLSTKMEDALAYSPMIVENERLVLDNSFVDWFKSSSIQLGIARLPSGEPWGVSILKNVMRWRYHLVRIILHRPVLLWYSMRRKSFDKLSEDKKKAIETCRSVTSDLISDIASTWKNPKPSRMAGWNAVWLLYQALMVPLLSLYSDGHNSSLVEKSSNLVETGLTTLSELRPWSVTADRSYEVVSRIYEASKRRKDEATQSLPEESDNSMQGRAARPTYINTASTHALEGSFARGPPTTESQNLFMDNMFDSLNWSGGWDEDSFLFDMPQMPIPDESDTWADYGGDV